MKVHSKDVKMDETVDLEAIALATSGAVGSDLANMINEAAITAVKHGRQVVSQKDLFEAVEVVLVGKEKKDRIMNRKSAGSYLTMKWGMALVSALQKRCGAGTEDHDCAKNYGSAWICDADAGRREVLKH